MSTINTLAGTQQPPRATIDPRAGGAGEARAPSAPAPDAQSTGGEAEANALAGDPQLGNDMRARLSALIQTQVDSGALSDAQAGELQRFFAETPAPGTGDPARAPAAAQGGAVSEAASRKLDALEAFLERLRASHGSTGSGYGAAGQGSAPGGMVLNARA